MAEEKKYTAREAAVAVLAKAHEILQKSEFTKALNYADGKPAPHTDFPRIAMSEKMGKAENPDAKADADLGEKIEHLCEQHMLENRDAERKEGHKIVKSEECWKCNMKKPAPSTGQGDTLRRPAKDAEWQMDKAEREGGVDVGSKKLGYKPSTLGKKKKSLNQKIRLSRKKESTINHLMILDFVAKLKRRIKILKKWRKEIILSLEMHLDKIHILRAI